MWSVLENISCTFENNRYSAHFVLCISTPNRYIRSDVSFKASVSLLIFCLYDLSIDISGVLKLFTIVVLFSVSP